MLLLIQKFCNQVLIELRQAIYPVSHGSVLSQGFELIFVLGFAVCRLWIFLYSESHHQFFESVLEVAYFFDRISSCSCSCSSNSKVEIDILTRIRMMRWMFFLTQIRISLVSVIFQK